MALTRQHGQDQDVSSGRVGGAVDAVREVLVSQSLAAAAGDPEAMQLDEDFLEALEYGPHQWVAWGSASTAW